ncbi:cornifelin-like [Lacerta agilis]|uniref:cornifelin-like n=1 Tax=Lacerta agilis TaxID=80427 RepID=UPI00141A0978|nr:cornifelin-like [Lacerta agilis]
MSQPVTCQPVATVSPLTLSSEGSWSSGRYDCCSDCPMCCVGLLCPAILACYVSRKHGENCCLGLVPGGMTALRTHMRLSYGIPALQQGLLKIVIPVSVLTEGRGRHFFICYLTLPPIGAHNTLGHCF